MGNSSSQTLKEYISTNVSFSQTVKTSLNLENLTNISTFNKQNATIINGGPGCCEIFVDGEYEGALPGCTGTDASLSCGAGGIAQTIDQNVTVIQEIDSEFSQDLATQLQNTAQADVSSALDQLQQNDLLSGMFNQTKQDVNTTVSNNINTTLDTETVENIVNSAVINSYNEQESAIVNCGTLVVAGDCSNQAIQITILVQNILSSIGDLVQSNSEVNDFYTKVNNTLSQKQQGVFGTFVDMFSNLGVAWIIAGAVFFFIILIVIFMLLFRKGGSTPTMSSPIPMTRTVAAPVRTVSAPR